MKDYMRKQTHGTKSYDLLEATLDYAFALVPYMHYSTTYELLLTCLHTILEFVDGSNQDDTNVIFVVENGFIKIVNAMLSLKYFLEDHKAGANFKRYKIKSSLIYSKEDKKGVIDSGEKDQENKDPENKNLEGEDEMDENLYVVLHNFKSIYDCSNKTSFECNLNYVLKWLEKPSTERIEKNMRRNEYALLPHEEKPEISTLKVKVMSALLELLDTKETTLDKVYYYIHTQLSPDVIRLNFSYQDALFKKYHQGKYRTSLFNKPQLGVDKVKDSYFVIEIGFLIFSLLYKLKLYYKEGRNDQLYKKTLLDVMPSETRQDTAVSDIWVFQFIEFFEDIYTRITRRFIYSGKIMHEQIEENSKYVEEDKSKDKTKDKVKDYMRFYAYTTSQIEILMEQKLVSYTFPILPY